MQLLIKIPIYIFIIYFMCTMLLYFFQRSILYRPDTTKPTISKEYQESIRAITIPTKDNLKLLAWYAKAQEDKPTIIYFHGNAGTIKDRVYNLNKFIQKGYGLLLLSYRGYAGNMGNPTEDGLYLDARAGFAYLEKENINLNDIIIFGESLGTGVAVQMALEHPTKMLILQSPYTSMSELAASKYPIFPVKWLLKDKYNSISKLANLQQKIIVFHGKRDIVVPMYFGKGLYDSYKGDKEIFIDSNAGHNNILTPRMSDKIIQEIAKLYN